uniref:Metalloendopeptidase n=1 Tax=Cyprinus carpio TaxID=7962 RepID=A0A8C2AGY1_CYPCA
MFVTKVTFGLLALLLVFSVRAEEMVMFLFHVHFVCGVLAYLTCSLVSQILQQADTLTFALSASRELDIIKRGLDSFSYSTCIRFFPRRSERDYISIESRSGCYSYVGRQGNSQTVSLARNGCLYHSTVQHELLHALGFNHEQTRNDRDNHIKVIWENIRDDMKYNFDKINTLNQGTPYDYSSVMQYERYAFSKNGRPTMVPIPNNNAALGTSTEMSQNDIIRINKLYQCCE